MPIKKAAFKHLRQTKRRTLRNRVVKSRLRALAKQTRVALEAQKPEDAKTAALQLLKAYDKAAQHRVLKKRAAARKKSRLMKRLNKELRTT